ncbi:MAG: hypothetical protein LBU64_01680 [Planctomycetota bacterium]|jgi:hypothetical protein|nr:hypothetical protein [Planctomycetota bacterium]
MRTLFFSLTAILLAVAGGCGPNSDSAGRETGGGGTGGGVSLRPLSIGGSPAGIITGEPYGTDSAQSYAPAARQRQPSPYDPILAGRYQYSLPAGPVTASPVYSGFGPAGSGDAGPVFSAPDPVLADGGAIRLVPAPDVPPGNHPGDATPSQWFEIVRPGNGPLRIGRMSTTCVCVRARAPKRLIAAGERALVEVRTVSRPPVNNVVYGLYLNLLEPERLTLDVDVPVHY